MPVVGGHYALAVYRPALGAGLAASGRANATGAAVVAFDVHVNNRPQHWPRALVCFVFTACDTKRRSAAERRPAALLSTP